MAEYLHKRTQVESLKMVTLKGARSGQREHAALLCLNLTSCVNSRDK